MGTLGVMKRSSIKRKSALRQVSAKKKAHNVSDKGKAGRLHMGGIASKPCCICEAFQMEQLSRTQVHHCIHGRGGNRKASDFDTIPLCEGHHQGLLDTSKIPLHSKPENWRANYGVDTNWLEKNNDNK